MEIERTGGLRIHADTGQIARQQMPPATSVITASSITSREHDSTPASASMMSPMTAADMAGVSIAMSSSAPPLLSIPVARTTQSAPPTVPVSGCGYCAASHTARDSSVIWLGATAEEMSLLITASTYGWVPNTIATSF